MSEKTLERIKIASLQLELAQVKKDYNQTVSRFRDLSCRCCTHQGEFPLGFVDVFASIVVSAGNVKNCTD